jgi:ligand-binding sensor domain-containing protein/DNA-binding CsgD family transcriptional regulator
MSRVLHFFFVLSFCLQGQVVLAQGEVLHFEYLTISEGLPHNTVYCIAQDRNGLMWFGTQDGLVRFDGYECRVMRQQEADTSGFLGNSIHCLLQDRDGNLWAGTRTNGINFRDATTGAFKNLKSEPALRSISKSWINTLCQDRKGRIWIGTINNGLLIYDPQTHSSEHYDKTNSALTDNAILKIIEDKAGKIWVGASGTGIYYFDESTRDFQKIHSSISGDTDFQSFRKTLHADNKGHIWIGTEGSGLYQLDPASGQLQRFTIRDGLTSNNIMCIAENDQGHLLLATDGGGLNILDPVTGHFSVYKYEPGRESLNTNALYHVSIDRDGNVWIGTYNGGVNINKIHKTWFETLSLTGIKTTVTTTQSVLSLCEARDGSVFVGSDGAGLFMFHKETKTIDAIPNHPAGYGNVVKTILEDSHNRLWLGYFNDGLSYYDRKNGTFRHYRANASDSMSLSGNNVWSIAEGEEGKLWIGIIGGGVNLFDPETGRFKRFRHHPGDSSSISSDDVMTVLADKQSHVWIGTATDGLNLFDKSSGKFKRFVRWQGNEKSLSANDVRCIFQDSKNRLWVGTETGGLNLWLGNNEFAHFTVEDGLISNAIMGIVEDSSGYLWLSTFKGIIRFEPETKKCLNFDFHNNPYITANQFNQAAILADATGTLYFGGINGLTFLQADDVRIYETKSSVVITDFRIFNKSVPVGKMADGRTILSQSLQEASQINLSYYDNAFSFEFAALDYTEPFKSQYAFKMDGFDRGWRSTSSDQRVVTYTNLDPGTYFFRVKGTNSNGIWSDEKIMKVVIAPPYWQTWWFKAIILLLLAGLAWLSLRIYLTRREMTLKQKVLESERAILTLTNENLISEQTILQLQNEKLAVEIKSKSAELMSYAVQAAHKNEILIGVKEKLEEINSASDQERAARLIRGLRAMISAEIEGEKSWEQFTTYFNEVNQNFITELLKKHPSLTQNDLRMCALTRLNMSNKEMAALLNISVQGVEKSRYRLKKHLGLTAEDDLAAYLRII